MSEYGKWIPVEERTRSWEGDSMEDRYLEGDSMEDRYLEGDSMEDRYLCKAKRTDNGGWVTGCLVRYGFTGREKYYIVPSYASDLYALEIDPSTICWCTGLKDKNGKLIWEGDVLDGFTYPYMSGGVHNYYVEVCWCSNVPGFGIYTQKYPESKVAGISAGMTELMEDWNPNDWKVIGNKFDTPELLEV